MVITARLFEHYLRATGWTWNGGWWTRAGFPRIGTFDDMSEQEIGVQVSRVAEADHVPAHVTSARLGLCSAAESSFEFCRKHVLGGSPRGEVIADQARSHLRLASVDPEAWEDAR